MYVSSEYMLRITTEVFDSPSVICFGACDAVEIGHADVEDGDVGFQLRGLRHRLAAIFRFADDTEVRLLLDHEPKATTHARVIVRGQDANFPWAWAHADALEVVADEALASIGSSARMMVRVP